MLRLIKFKAVFIILGIKKHNNRNATVLHLDYFPLIF